MLTLNFLSPSSGTSRQGRFGEDEILADVLPEIAKDGLGLTHDGNANFETRNKRTGQQLTPALSFKANGVKDLDTLEVRSKMVVAAITVAAAEINEVETLARNSGRLKLTRIDERTVEVTFDARHLTSLENGGAFGDQLCVRIRLAPDHPASPPDVYYKAPVVSHHVNSDGKLCYGKFDGDTLKEIIERAYRVVVGDPAVIDLDSNHYSAAACQWYREHKDRLPLDRRPLFAETSRWTTPTAAPCSLPGRGWSEPQVMPGAAAATRWL